jgi:hypothetical protein
VYIFQLNTCGRCPYITSPLMRGWVYHLQLLLVLARAVILGSESRGIHGHILGPQIRDSPNLEGQVTVFITPRNRVAQLYPQALGSFRRLLRLAGLRWRYSNPLTYGVNSVLTSCPAYNISAWTAQKTPFLCCCLRAVA